MATRWTLALMGLAMLCAMQAPALADLDRDTVDRIKDATVYIDVTNRTEDGVEDGSTGSGFVYDPRGLVMTNQHVIDPRIEVSPNRYVEATEQEVVVTFHRATPLEMSYPATVERAHGAADLAVLKLPEGNYPSLELGDSTEVFETQTVYAAGHPLGLDEISIRTGTITSKRTFDDLPYLEHSVNVEHGNSGGPVFDSDGRVVGVVCFTLSAAEQNTNFAIPSQTLERFLQGTLPEPQLQGGSDRAFLQALLDGTELTFEEAEGGLYLVPFENDVNVGVSASEDWVLVQIYLGTIQGTPEEVAYIHEQLLRANFDYYIGKFGLDEDGDLWVEHHLSRTDVGPEELDECVRLLARLGIMWRDGTLLQ
jgi:S1-C subfamily serine protease